MQEKSSSRRSGPCGTTLTGHKNGWYDISFEMSPADIEHGTDDIAHHVMEEAVPANAIDQQRATFGRPLVPGRRKDRADARGHVVRIDGALLGQIQVPRRQIGIGGGKAEEVVITHKILRGGVKLAEIQGPRDGENVASEEWRTNVVSIGFANPD